MELITSHTNSDFDSLGAMIAAKKLYPDATLSFPGSQESTLRRFFIESSSYAAGFEKAKDVNLEEVTKLIMVDVDSPKRMGRFCELVGKPGVELHIYDHHPEAPETAGAKVKVIERVGAATTILVLLIKERGLEVTPLEATIMALGVYEDTGGLTFVTTTEKDFEAASFLLSRGADLTTVREFITPELTSDQVSLLDDLLKNLKVEDIFGVKVAVSTAEAPEYMGDLALLVHKISDMENLDSLIVYALMGDRIHMVLRSRVAELDVSEVARHFGGGGHPEAASATVHDKTPLEVAEELENILPMLVKPRRTARDLMSSPPRTVRAGATLLEVKELLNRYHVNAMPVLKGETLVGVITRLVAERASAHGLGEAPVDSYMSADFDSLEPTAPLEAVRDAIVNRRQRLLPIVLEGKLMGVVTRTDLLLALTPKLPAQAGKKGGAEVKNLKKTALELFGKPVSGLLKELGEEAAREGMSAFLVGGMVRDLMLRTPNTDVDVVVEGDAIALAKKLAGKWGAACHPYPPFGTAKLIMPDGLELDVATARTEYYTHPAALPTVEQSSLKLDLSRRDFSINALAMRLTPTGFGEIIDFFGGLRDLKDGYVSVLHNLSFVDDPTRILRALRFSLRFGFKLKPQTKRLLKASLAEGFLEKAKGPRLFKELKALYREADPVAATQKLEAEGILKELHPALTADPKTLERLDRAKEVAAWHTLLYTGGEFHGWRLYLLALLEPLSDEELKGWGESLGVAAREGANLCRTRLEANKALNTLRKRSLEDGLKDSEVYKALKGVGEEALLYAMAKTVDEHKRKAISRFHTKLSGAVTLINGDDLKRLNIPPGPHYRTILEEILWARLDGAIFSRAEEEALALAKWAGIIGEI